MDLEGFLQQHDPQVVIYDIAPPYDANWQLFQHISEMRVMRDRQIVLTSSNARQVEQLAGRREKIYEIVGKPLDLDQIAYRRQRSRTRPPGSIGRVLTPIAAPPVFPRATDCAPCSRAQCGRTPAEIADQATGAGVVFLGQQPDVVA